jgi:hypothetical protein
LEQALNTALAVREAIRQEKVAETFYTKLETSTEVSERGGNSRSDTGIAQNAHLNAPTIENTSAATITKIPLEGIGTHKEGRNPNVTNANDVGTLPTNALRG